MDALKSNEILLNIETPPHEEDEGEEGSDTGLVEDAHGEQHGLSTPFLPYFPLNEENEKENREGEECGNICDSPSIKAGKALSIRTAELSHSPDILRMTGYGGRSRIST